VLHEASNPITGLDRPIVFQEVEDPRFQDNRHMKVVRLSALRTGRLYPPGIIPDTHFCWRLSQPQGHSAAGRIMSMKNSNDTIGNRTRYFPNCSAVPQLTAPPRGPLNGACFVMQVNGMSITNVRGHCHKLCNKHYESKNNILMNINRLKVT
jgi:hypothetical protein